MPFSRFWGIFIAEAVKPSVSVFRFGLLVLTSPKGKTEASS